MITLSICESARRGELVSIENPFELEVMNIQESGVDLVGPQMLSDIGLPAMCGEPS